MALEAVGRVVSKIKTSKVAFVLIVLTFVLVAVLATVEVNCDRCGGDGTVIVPAFRAPSQTRVCPKCGGEGRILAIQTLAGYIGIGILGIGILTAVISALKSSWISEFKTKPLGIGLFVILNIITSVFYLIFILIPAEIWSRAYLLFFVFLYFSGADFSHLSSPLYFSDRLIGLVFIYPIEALKPILYWIRVSYPMLVAYGLWNHKRWSWFLSIIPPLTIIILNLYTFRESIIRSPVYGPPLFAFHAISILLNILVIFYLTRPHIRNLFGISRS